MKGEFRCEGKCVCASSRNVAIRAFDFNMDNGADGVMAAPENGAHLFSIVLRPYVVDESRAKCTGPGLCACMGLCRGEEMATRSWQNHCSPCWVRCVREPQSGDLLRDVDSKWLKIFHGHFECFDLWLGPKHGFPCISMFRGPGQVLRCWQISGCIVGRGRMCMEMWKLEDFPCQW